MRILKGLLLFVVLAATWTATAIVGGLYGWWLKPIAEQGDFDGYLTAHRQLIEKQNSGNLNWFIYQDGKTHFGQHSAVGDKLNKDTLYPLASMSKMIAALGIMKLVEEQKIDLDAPVGQYLSRWSLPSSDFDAEQVTVRRLLSHTAGLNDGLGFGDYKANETLPSLEESLSSPRASSGPVEIKLGAVPGEQWNYSGGGYLIIELLIEEVSGQPYKEYIADALFKSLGMVRSTFSFLGDENNISKSYDASGKEVAMYQYASAAATGLSSSTQELSLLAQMLLAEGTSAVLNQQSVQRLRQAEGFKSGAPIWGAGAMLYVPLSNDDFVFGHDGGNSPAINSTLRINPQNNSAIIVLTTGNMDLASSLAYEWTLWQTGMPDFLAFEKAIASAALPAGLGALLIALLIFGLMYFRREK